MPFGHDVDPERSVYQVRNLEKDPSTMQQQLTKPTSRLRCADIKMGLRLHDVVDTGSRDEAVDQLNHFFDNLRYLLSISAPVEVSLPMGSYASTLLEQICSAPTSMSLNPPPSIEEMNKVRSGSCDQQ